MSKRDSLLYIEDIEESIEAINDYIKEMSYEEFFNDRKTYSATIREFIVIGEAISKIISVLEEIHPAYPWRILKDFRNFIVHEYFGVNPQIVFDAATLELEELYIIIMKIKEEINE
ncbi:MAG: HepT-like ribonuclease domain-containing protein [Campylobacterota bacterium]|nr:HepT-like ribonuclease domain-containing protein [Campylobacterota bacterium]